MDHALSFSHVLTSSTRPNMMMISPRSWTKPQLFFRNNHSPSISKFSNVVFCATSKLLRSSQSGHHALVSPSVHAQYDGKGDGVSITTKIIISSEPVKLGASFALACVLGIFCFGSMLVVSPKKATANSNSYSSAPEHLPGPMVGISPLSGKYGQGKFMEGIVFLGSETTLPQIKERALWKMREGISHKEILDQMYSAAKNLDQGPTGQYNFQMALVEILILQGEYEKALREYEKALNLSDCLDEANKKNQPSDLQRSLYSLTELLNNLRRSVVFLGSETTLPQIKQRALWKMREGISNKEILDQMKSAAKTLDRGPAGQYDFQMALVEILILQGEYEKALREYEEALKLSGCPNETNENISPSDLRRSLYGAIIYTMLDDNKAKMAWKQFIDKGFVEGLPN